MSQEGKLATQRYIPGFVKGIATTFGDTHRVRFSLKVASITLKDQPQLIGFDLKTWKDDSPPIDEKTYSITIDGRILKLATAGLIVGIPAFFYFLGYFSNSK